MMMLRRFIFFVDLAAHLYKAPKGLLSEAQIIEMIRGTRPALLVGARNGAMTVV